MKALLATACALVLTIACLAAEQHWPSNDDLRQLRNVTSAEISPDLKHVVVTLTDSTADGGQTHLWMLDTEGSNYRQLTFKDQPGKSGERSPQFLPDGSAILFIAQKDKPTLFRLPLQGGESVEVAIKRMPEKGKAEADVSISSYSVSPDGAQVAVIAQDPDPATLEADRKDKKDAIWFEHDEHRSRLYLLDTKTWKAREAPLAGNLNVEQVAWSDQPGRLLAITRATSSDLGPSAQGWIIDTTAQAAPRAVNGMPKTTERAAWTHHGNGLALLAQCELDAPPGCSDLYTLSLTDGKLRNLSRNLKDASLSPQTLRVAPDDRSVLVSASKGMKHTLARFDLASSRADILSFAGPVVSGLTANRDERAWVYLASSSTSAPAVYMTGALNQPAKRLAQPVTMPEEWKTVPSRTITWKRDGLTIEGLLYMPPQAYSARVPLIVNVHGGPTGQFTDGYSPLVNLLAGQGWAVLQVNPRGSTGYGVAFEATNKEDMGNGDYLDIMAGVDEALRIAPIDPARMALIGYSYGGEMAGFVVGKTTRFKAIVSGAPVIDQFSEYGTESDSFGDRWFTGMPWRHFEDSWRQSPLAYAEHAKTPFLLLQGETDTTDPEGQSQEMYRALRQEGVPVQMVLFPRENHGALGANFAGWPSMEPWHGVIARDHMIRFISDAFDGKVAPNPP